MRSTKYIKAVLDTVSHLKSSWVRHGLLGLALIVAGCATHPDYATQFRFPTAWGDIAMGQQAFIELECHQCHTVSGVPLPLYEGESPLTLELGGDIIYAKTYADLVTSIINPDHALSEKYLDSLPREERRDATSVMPLKHQMTVAQLVDVVMFLNARYVLLEGYEETYYR